MKAIIMAGGRGTRLLPLTASRPKPLMTVAGRPCISHTAALLRKAGIGDIAVTAQYKKEMIRAWADTERVTVIEENEPLGTAGGVRNAREFLRGSGTFVVISGDALCDFDLKAAASFHAGHDGPVTVLSVRREVPLEYGVIVTERDGRIKRFIEKPSWDRAFSDRVNTGIYFLDESLLDDIPAGKPFDFSSDLFPLLMKRGVPLYAYDAPGYWCDIGDLEAYRQCNMDVLDGRVGHGTETDASQNIVGENSLIKGEVFHSVLGENVTVREGASVRGCVIGKGCVIGRGARLFGCTLGENVTVDEDGAVYDGAVIGDGATVGKNAAVSCDMRLDPGTSVHPSVRLTTADRQNENAFDGAVIAGRIDARTGAEAGAAAAACFRGIGAIGYEDMTLSAVAMSVFGGVTAGGCDVLDLGVCDEWVLRYTVRSYGLSFGIFVGRDKTVFVEDDGLEPSCKNKRLLMKYFRSDPPEARECGKYRTMSGCDRMYKRRLKRCLLDMPALKMYLDAPSFLSDSIVALPRSGSLCLTVRHGVHAPGTDDALMQCACLYAFGRTYGRAFVPYGFPRAAEEIGRRGEFEVIRLDTEDKDRRYLYDLSDPYISGAVLIRYLAKHDITLEALLRSLPPVARCERETVSPRGRGAVMGELTAAAGREDELVEGIGLYDKLSGCYVRVIPCANREAFRVVTEAANAEAAEEICADWCARLGSPLDKNGKK